MLLLSVESENGATLTYRLQKTKVSVGSGPSNDVVVSGPGVGDRHMVIQRTGNAFTFTTAERQSVVLNGERRSRGVLNPGDRVRLGSVTLVFRGEVGGQVAFAEEPAPKPSKPQPPAAEGLTLKPEPGGFARARMRLLEVFAGQRPERTRQVVSVLREAVPEAEFALLIPKEGGGPGAEGAVLASLWTGELPTVPGALLRELATPGKYATLGGGRDGGEVVFLPVRTPRGNLVALLVARPAGALGDEGVALAGEAARLLGLFWEEVERTDASFASWELEARTRLEALIPGTSQAVQVLREGLLQAGRGYEPVLICGAEGTGRTEVARLLSTLGPVAGRRVVLFEGRDAHVAVLRQELFGPSGKPTFTAPMEGLVGQARGALLVIRNVEKLPEPVQLELAGVLKVQAQEPLSASTTRWVATCGEDPLALVQQGKFASALFVLFSQRMLRVPRLEERREDLPLIIASLLRQVAAEQRKNVRGITVECLNVLLSRSCPGQMAELVGELRRLVAATPEGEMVRCDAALASPAPGSTIEGAEILASDNLKEVVPRVEQLIIDRVMRKVKGNQSKGARVLGISRGALIAKIKEYNIPDYRYLRRRRG